MHSQTRLEGERAATRTAVSHAGTQDLGVHGGHGQNGTAWTELPDAEFEAVG